MAEEDIHTYSIDEQFGDLTHSWKLFGNSSAEVGKRIQKEIIEKIGIYTSLGMGDNPLLAKIAMDIEAKSGRIISLNGTIKMYQKKFGRFV